MQMRDLPHALLSQAGLSKSQPQFFCLLPHIPDNLEKTLYFKSAANHARLEVVQNKNFIS